MLTMKEVKLLLPKGSWTVSLDLKDGFWHVPIAPSFRRYLGFTYKGQDWQFRALPFGLNIAPRIFTKVVSHVVKRLSEQGIWCLPYLDDLLIIARSKEACLLHCQLTMKLLTSLGWIINLKKSRLIPGQTFEWLGVQFDLRQHTAQSPRDKLESVCSIVSNLIVSNTCSIREVMKLQGIINWIGQVHPSVRTLMSSTRYIIRCFKGSQLDSHITLDRFMKLSLCKWFCLRPIPQVLGNPSPDLTIMSDASLRGWGFQINGFSFQGSFDESMSYSINVLELITVWFALLTIQSQGNRIQILCDNSTAVGVVKKGTSFSPMLSAIAQLIWRRAEKYQWQLHISHIKGSYNVIADQLSRNQTISTEWSLPRKDFQKILRLNPHLQVDLFATSYNNQLQTFVSPCPDERAVGQDSLTLPWDRWDHLYLFPPTVLISKVLGKILQSAFISAILLTPEMPTRPWYMALRQLNIQSTVLQTTLQQRVGDQLIKMNQPSKLRVWRLLGAHMKRGSTNATEKLGT